MDAAAPDGAIVVGHLEKKVITRTERCGCVCAKLAELLSPEEDSFIRPLDEVFSSVDLSGSRLWKGFAPHLCVKDYESFSKLHAYKGPIYGGFTTSRSGVTKGVVSVSSRCERPY